MPAAARLCGNAACPDITGEEEPNSGWVSSPTTPVTSSRSSVGICTPLSGAVNRATWALAPAVRKSPSVVPNIRPASETRIVASANRPVTSTLTPVAPTRSR